MYCEHGGRGLHQHLLIFARAKGSEARLLENLYMSNGVTKRPASIAELKAFIAGGRASVASRGEAPRACSGLAHRLRLFTRR